VLILSSWKLPQECPVRLVIFHEHDILASLLKGMENIDLISPFAKHPNKINNLVKLKIHSKLL
jgi:hypothetical protein